MRFCCVTAGGTPGGSAKWTARFTHWLDAQRFDHSVQAMVFAEYVRAEASAASRVVVLEKQMHEALEQWSLQPVVQALRALRGVDTVAAMTLIAELGNLRRFDSPRQLMAYLGLVPSEQSSGNTMRRGGITKTGNGHARRILVESAWSLHWPRLIVRSFFNYTSISGNCPATVHPQSFLRQRFGMTEFMNRTGRLMPESPLATRRIGASKQPRTRATPVPPGRAGPAPWPVWVMCPMPSGGPSCGRFAAALCRTGEASRPSA